MSLTRAALLKFRPAAITFIRAMSNDGAIREGGGAFSKKEKAQEDQYFRKQAQEQLKNIKSHMEEEISHHEDEIKRHQERVKKLKEKAKNLVEK